VSNHLHRLGFRHIERGAGRRFLALRSARMSKAMIRKQAGGLACFHPTRQGFPVALRHKRLPMASKRDFQNRQNRANRFLRTALKAWRAGSLDDLPAAARFGVVEVMEHFMAAPDPARQNDWYNAMWARMGAVEVDRL